MWMEGRWPRALVSLLLGVSGLLAVAGARERWWPTCRPGDFDTPGCLARQSDRFDYPAMSDTWVPVGRAAELAGASYAALALAVALLPWLLMRARPRVAASAGLVLGGTLLPVAAALWLSGRAGEIVAVPLASASALAGALLWPVAAVAVVVAVHTHAGARLSALQRGAQTLLAALLCLCSPLGQVAVGLLIAPVLLGYVSHDTTPWTEAVSGGLLVLAAVAAWPATGPRRRATPRPSTGTQPPLPVGRASLRRTPTT